MSVSGAATEAVSAIVMRNLDPCRQGIREDNRPDRRTVAGVGYFDQVVVLRQQQIFSPQFPPVEGRGAVGDLQREFGTGGEGSRRTKEKQAEAGQQHAGGG